MPSVYSLVNSPQQKNYFKNPNFKVIQGSSSGTLANSTAVGTASVGYPGETEWIVAANGATPAYAFSSVNENLTITGAAGIIELYVSQRIESKDVITLANKLATMTFSVELSNSLLTTVQWYAYRCTTLDDTHGVINNPTQTQIATGTFTVSSTLARYSSTFTLPAIAAKGIAITLRVTTQTSGAWVVSRLQLEEGAIATNFNCDDYGKELLKCQKFYLSPALYVGQSGVFFTDYTFPATMFATPIRTGGGAGYGEALLNSYGICNFQTAQAIQVFTFSAHIP